MAGGVAVATYAPDLGVAWGSGAVALGLVFTGLATALGGYRRWRGNEEAIREDRALPQGLLPAVLAAAVAVVVIVVGRPRRGRGDVPVTTPPTGTRTGLAWQRTGLGLIAIAALVGARALNTGEEVLLITAGGAALVGAGIMGVLGPMRQRQLRRRTAADEDVAAPGAVAVLTLAVVLLAVLAGVAVIAVPLR